MAPPNTGAYRARQQKGIAMRRFPTFTLAAALLAVAAGAPGANAGPISKYHGGCSMVAVADPTEFTFGPGVYQGVMTATVVAYSTGEVDADPVSATVRCYVLVNGALQGGSVLTRSGAGAVIGAGHVFYTRPTFTDEVQVCTLVDYTSDATPSTVKCQQVATFELPPPMANEIIDPIVCPAFAAAPGEVGPLLISAQGDVRLAGTPFWDCPPRQAEDSPPGPLIIDLAVA